MNKQSLHYIILGTGIAGFSAAERIRQLDPFAAITMIGAEPELPYLRPLLSKTWFASFRRKAALLAEPSWYEENHITLRLGTRVEKLLWDSRQLLLAGGELLSYDSLICALGAESFVPAIPGHDRSHVYTLRTIADFARIRLALPTAHRAVVIGGGVVGLEIASELSAMQLAVTVLEAAPRIMGRLLDEKAASLLTEHLHTRNIQCYSGVTIAEILENAVILSDGRAFPCDLVILSCGIRANTGLAREAGIACGRGILVDEQLRTDKPHIYAAGDCIEQISEDASTLPNPGLWNYSRLSGTSAAENAFAENSGLEGAAFRPASEPVILQCAGLGLFVIGDTGAEDSREKECALAAAFSRENTFLVNPLRIQTPVYRKLFYHGSRLCGAILLGDLSGMEAIRKELEGEL